LDWRALQGVTPESRFFAFPCSPSGSVAAVLDRPYGDGSEPRPLTT